MSTENKYSNILAASKSDSILAVIEGLPVDANGFFLSAEQMDNINATLATTNQIAVEASETLTAANEQLATLQTQLETQNAQLETANARIAELESGNGAAAADTSIEKDNVADTKKTTINNPNSSLNRYATSVGL